jgi:hypothetical protein
MYIPFFVFPRERLGAASRLGPRQPPDKRGVRNALNALIATPKALYFRMVYKGKMIHHPYVIRRDNGGVPGSLVVSAPALKRHNRNAVDTGGIQGRRPFHLHFNNRRAA